MARSQAALAFRLLQAGDAAAALEASRRAIEADPSDARAHLAAGLASRALGRLAESRAAIEQAARLDPADHGAAYEYGVALELEGRAGEALPWFERAVASKPAFAAARHALGWALHRARRVAEALPHLEAAAAVDAPQPAWILNLAKALSDLRRWEEARAQYRRAIELAPADAAARVAYGRFCVRRADFAAAAEAFRAACDLEPARIEWPMYLAQVELLRGAWEAGWQGYRRREQRVRFEARMAAEGRPYRVPVAGELPGSAVTIVQEQGLGDELFFLRFAPALREAGARLAYVGERRLLPLLERTRLFDTLHALEDLRAVPDGLVVLSADLPQVVPRPEPFAPSLRVAPSAAALEEIRGRLQEVGPRPWIGITWRSGTPNEISREALYKAVPVDALCAALARVPGTVVAAQRAPREGEIAAASQALGRPVHDFGAASQELDHALALTTLLDRHIGVSSTNMHLAAAAGATADVLVPFPPEWRWRIAGDSPWFPGFRVHRQDRDGDWSAALAGITL